VIEIVNRQRLIEIDRAGIAALAAAALVLVEARSAAGAQGRPSAETRITLVFVRDKKMRALNRDYRGRDYPTDVLSFRAADEAGGEGGFGAAEFLGDLVIAADTALRQANEAGQSLEREVQELVIHGVLHLCGYDHETDNGEMNRLEYRLRKKLLD
jgi:probable rRNA maturation factor